MAVATLLRPYRQYFRIPEDADAEAATGSSNSKGKNNNKNNNGYDDADPSADIFDVERFLQNLDGDLAPFVRQLAQSQMFSNFIAARVKLTEPDSFDQYILLGAERMARLNAKHRERGKLGRLWLHSRGMFGQDKWKEVLADVRPSQQTLHGRPELCLYAFDPALAAACESAGRCRAELSR